MSTLNGSDATSEVPVAQSFDLEPFLADSYDPIEYLNSTLSPLTTTSAPSIQNGRALSLSELSAQTQTVLSQLSAQTTRLSDILTQLTDEILRSGSRLAYEVEVLRGDTAGLVESLHENLKVDVEVFVPAGSLNSASTHTGEDEVKDGAGASDLPIAQDPAAKQTDQVVPTPPYISQLRTLTNVRQRLDAVIKVFGDAMEWTIPPSEVSMASSFISVSAPEPGSESHSREEKGQRVAKAIREEITALLNGSPTPKPGVEAATKRVDELRELSKVWKGTAEEKSRNKFVDGLAKMVDDRRKQAEREVEAQNARKSASGVGSPRRTALPLRDAEAADGQDQSRVAWSTRDGSYGFINQLQKMRGGL